MLRQVFHMKKMRLHIYIVLGIFLVGFIVGSFVDLSLSQALFSRDNTFGLTMSAIGTLPGYMILAVLGGGFFAIGLKKEYKTAWRFVLFVAAIACTGCAIYFSGREFFGENGFRQYINIKWVGYLIALPIAGGCGYLGYYLSKKSNNKYLWLVLAVAAACIFLALVPGVTMIKAIFHRPRYRLVEAYSSSNIVSFHNWWQRCKEYKDLMSAYNISGEEFKSFPSGHAGASLVFALGVCILPFVDKKYEKLQLPLFYCGVAWALFISFTRILVGAHFLSDVSMGGLLTTVFMLVLNEVLIALNKKYKFEPELA